MWLRGGCALHQKAITVVPCIAKNGHYNYAILLLLHRVMRFGWKKKEKEKEFNCLRSRKKKRKNEFWWFLMQYVTVKKKINWCIYDPFKGLFTVILQLHDANYVLPRAHTQTWINIWSKYRNFHICQFIIRIVMMEIWSLVTLASNQWTCACARVWCCDYCCCCCCWSLRFFRITFTFVYIINNKHTYEYIS